MSRPQWSESTNSFSEIPGTVQGFLVHFAAVVQQGRKRPDDDYGQSNPQTAEGNVTGFECCSVMHLPDSPPRPSPCENAHGHVSRLEPVAVWEAMAKPHAMVVLPAPHLMRGVTRFGTDPAAREGCTTVPFCNDVRRARV